MIAIRHCRRCGLSFDADANADLNIFCEDCREIINFISDVSSEEPDIEEMLEEIPAGSNSHLYLETGDAPSPETDTLLENVPGLVTDSLLESVQKNLEKYKKDHPPVSRLASVHRPHKRRRPSTIKPPKPSCDVSTDIDDETLAFLDSLDLESQI